MRPAGKKTFLNNKAWFTGKIIVLILLLSMLPAVQNCGFSALSTPASASDSAEADEGTETVETVTAEQESEETRTTAEEKTSAEEKTTSGEKTSAEEKTTVEEKTSSEETDDPDFSSRGADASEEEEETSDDSDETETIVTETGETEKEEVTEENPDDPDPVPAPVTEELSGVWLGEYDSVLVFLPAGTARFYPSKSYARSTGTWVIYSSYRIDEDRVYVDGVFDFSIMSPWAPSFEQLHFVPAADTASWIGERFIYHPELTLNDIDADRILK